MEGGHSSKRMNAPFSLAFSRRCVFGALSATHLPDGVEPVSEDVLGRLHPEERAVAIALRGRRQIEFTGGRIAYRAQQPLEGPLLTGADGEPLAPAGLSVSLTHKRDLALALVGEASAGTLGLDLEGDGRERMTIAERVLRPEELASVQALPAAEQWPAVQLRFALKEAAYKAIHPHLRRFVGFQEALVELSDPPTVRIFTRPEEPALALEAAWESLPGTRVLALVRAKVIPR